MGKGKQSMNNLVEDIKNLQTFRGLSDKELAQKLGVDPSTWSKIKNGHRPPGGKFLRAVAKQFPELRKALMGYLSNPSQTVSAPNPHNFWPFRIFHRREV